MSLDPNTIIGPGLRSGAFDLTSGSEWMPPSGYDPTGFSGSPLLAMHIVSGSLHLGSGQIATGVLSGQIHIASGSAAMLSLGSGAIRSGFIGGHPFQFTQYRCEKCGVISDWVDNVVHVIGPSGGYWCKGCAGFVRQSGSPVGFRTPRGRDPVHDPGRL